MNRHLRWFVAMCLTALPAFGDAGVLLPANAKQPDPAVLSLAEMGIEVVIDNADARVSIRQIFANHRGAILEGNYIFSLPGRALISDFAVWDDVTRVPGVVLERKRAEEIYNDIRMQALDPGLLQMGERGPNEARRGSEFVARVAPIPAWGNKRIEIEYHERLPIEQFKGYFAIPLRPDVYRAQLAGKLSIRFDFKTEHTLRDFKVTSKSYPLGIADQTAHRVRGTFEANGVNLAEDFAVEYSLEPPKSDTLAVITHRDPNEPGFFEASTLLRMPSRTTAQAARTVIALFDTSLSMQWEKLDRSYRALEALLRSLAPPDRFNLILFNSESSALSSAPVAAEPAAIEKALAFVRESRLRGSTDLQRALEAGLKQNGRNSYLVLLGDGGATTGVLQNGKLAEWFTSRWQQIPTVDRPRTYAFAVGDDANVSLLRMLARANGTMEHVRSTEPVEFKLNAFLSKIGRNPIDGFDLAAAPASSVSLVYPLEEAVFPGSLAAWVGQYSNARRVTLTARGTRDGTPVEARTSVHLPPTNPDHPDLPRTWAKARVDALLEKIEREGEDQATIDEIIRLARKYKFVTPYTSFLAAPRALLRPRLIRPGDPVLRVKTDPSIASITAIFPFGLVKKLRYLDQEDTWQTRFLAPRDMQDGTYTVRLILRDREGRTYRESKTFVIASKPPAVRVRLEKTRYRPGEAVRLRVSASETARTIIARMYGAAPAYIRWNPEMAANTGELLIPTHVAAGRYKLSVTAEDFAHNIGTAEVAIEVVP
jgi:Ca-activated chloride channel family protein